MSDMETNFLAKKVNWVFPVSASKTRTLRGVGNAKGSADRYRIQKPYLVFFYTQHRVIWHFFFFSSFRSVNQLEIKKPEEKREEC